MRLFQLSETTGKIKIMATTGTRVRSGRTVSSSKSRKVIERVRQKIQEGSFYEAHQTYRALYQRFCAQGSEEQAISLLLEGASTLLKHQQVGRLLKHSEKNEIKN